MAPPHPVTQSFSTVKPSMDKEYKSLLLLCSGASEILKSDLKLREIGYEHEVVSIFFFSPESETRAEVLVPEYCDLHPTQTNHCDRLDNINK